MNAIKEYITHLSTYTVEAQEKRLLQIVRQYENILLDMNTGQLMDGIDSNGEPLKPYQSALYAEFKKTLNPKGVTDLNLTGDFHQDFYVNTNQFPILIDSTNEKTTELRRNYGEDIFGVTPENKANFVEEISQDIIAYYTKVLQLR